MRKAPGTPRSQTAASASAPLTNLPARQRRSLNGNWQALVDPYADGIGEWKAVWKDRTASGKTEFYRIRLRRRVTLHVPGDFNTQRPELMWLEGSVWYRKAFEYDVAPRAAKGGACSSTSAAPITAPMCSSTARNSAATKADSRRSSSN